jgi:hypothetical protein
VLFALGSVGCTRDYPLITALPPVVTEKPPTGTVMLTMSATAPAARIQQPGFLDGGGSNRFDRPTLVNEILQAGRSHRIPPAAAERTDPGPPAVQALSDVPTGKESTPSERRR